LKVRVDRKVQPNERLKVSDARARQRALGRGLRAHFNEFTDEAIPDDFLNLLEKLDTVVHDDDPAVSPREPSENVTLAPIP
jgi:hypothetical protein